MDYIITDGTHFVKNDQGKTSFVTDITKAHRFQLQKAQNFMVSFKSALGDYDWEIQPYDCSSMGTIISNPFNESPINLVEKVKEISDFAKKINEYHCYLVSELSKVDLEITDIEHAAEFYNLDVVKGYKLYKMLQERRIRRRHTKNELDSIGYIMKNNIANYGEGTVTKSLAGLETKKYQPRILKELFE